MISRCRSKKIIIKQQLHEVGVFKFQQIPTLAHRNEEFQVKFLLTD